MFFLSESRCSAGSNSRSRSSSSSIKICNFSRSWRSKRSGEINFIMNKKNNAFCLNDSSECSSDMKKKMLLM